MKTLNLRNRRSASFPTSEDSGPLPPLLPNPSVDCGEATSSLVDSKIKLISVKLRQISDHPYGVPSGVSIQRVEAVSACAFWITAFVSFMGDAIRRLRLGQFE